MISVATAFGGVLLFTMALRGRTEPSGAYPDAAPETRSSDRRHVWNLHGGGDLLSDLTCAEFVELGAAFLDGTLDSMTERRLVDHIPNCDGCERYLDQFRQTIRTLGGLPAQSLGSEDREAVMTAFRDLLRCIRDSRQHQLGNRGR